MAIEKEIIQGVKIKIPETEEREDSNQVDTFCEGHRGYGVRIFHREAGTSAGQEYHTGADPSKSPERFYIVQGEMEFDVYNGTQDKKFTVGPRTEVEISSWIWHATRAITNVSYIKYIELEKSEFKDTNLVSKEKYKQILDRHLKRE